LIACVTILLEGDMAPSSLEMENLKKSIDSWQIDSRGNKRHLPLKGTLGICCSCQSTYYQWVNFLFIVAVISINIYQTC